MEVIPAIDLMNGKVVRLKQGAKETAKIYSDNPVSLAKLFQVQGASWLHLVDLDRAFGIGDNLTTISRIAAVPGIKVEAGGGLRSFEDAVELLERCVGRIVVGTVALQPKALEEFAAKLGKKVWVACDVKNGQVAVKGWEQATEMTVEKLLERVSKFDIGGVIVTDISRDGMQAGVSEDFLIKIRKKTNLPLIASGGISSIGDVKRIAELGFNGGIIGKALYENKLSLRKAIEVGKDAG